MKRALYIGKFQPFAIHHLAIVENIDKAPDIDEIVIAVGSSQWNAQNRDPERFWLDNMFTIEERVAIIESSLKGKISKKFYIVPIIDFLPKWGADTTPKWFSYIKTHCPKFHCLYSNRVKAVKLFSEAGFETRPNPMEYNFSATMVREKMALGDTWQPLVCAGAASVIEKMGGPNRAAELFAKGDYSAQDYSKINWEWRTFSDVDKSTLTAIMDLPTFRDEDVLDQYLFSLLRTSINFKLRKHGFKIKKLLTRDASGLEAWASFDSALPAEKNWFVQGCRSVKFPVPQGLPDQVDEETLATTTQEPNPYVFLLPLNKRRWMRIYHPYESFPRCGIDITMFFMKGKRVVTVGLEAANKKDLEITLEYFGLQKYAPMNYLQFLERYFCKEAGDAIWQKL